MTTAFVILGGFLGLAISLSAVGKIKRIPGAIESIASVGVKESQYNQLALLEILGALGLFLGIWMPIIGIAASIGITLYFVGALTAHLRKKDSVAKFFPALLLLVVAIATMILQFKRGR